jgi:short-subunit dehydrogenase
MAHGRWLRELQTGSVDPLPLSLSSGALVDAIKDLDIGLFAAVAGYGTSGEFIRNSISEEVNMIDVNCRAVIEQVHYFAKMFAQKKRGGIILMG